jgi:hypothetical protein
LGPELFSAGLYIGQGRDGGMFCSLLFYVADLTVEIPSSLLEVLDVISFLPSTPDVLHSVAKQEAHVLRNGYALDT